MEYMRSGCKIFLSVWDCDYLGHIKDGSLNYVTYAYLAFITSYIEDASHYFFKAMSLE